MCYSLSAKQRVNYGINWGGGSLADNYKCNIQKTMPSFNEFRDLYKANEYKFLKRLEPFFKIYLDLDVSSGEFNYSNFCFFRTPDISSLRNEDFEASVSIFRDMIENIHPAWIISLGTNNIKYFRKYLNDSDFNCERISVGETKHQVYKGKLARISFYNLPHPFARNLSNETYHNLWKSLFSGEHKA